MPEQCADERLINLDCDLVHNKYLFRYSYETRQGEQIKSQVASLCQREFDSRYTLVSRQRILLWKRAII